MPEHVLWFALRKNRLAGLKFRRQHPIEPYVVDFYCPAAKLVVEVDGESHVGQAADDESRERFLARQGLRVVRFTNDDVLNDMDAVLEAILEAAGQNAKLNANVNPASPIPLPLREGLGEGDNTDLYVGHHDDKPDR